MNTSTDSKLSVALVVSHPIQHFCPQYVSFAMDPQIRFKVFFASALGQKPYHDQNFKKLISWNNLQLQKFDHEFLNGQEVLKADKNLDAPNVEEALKSFGPDVVIIYGYYQKLQRRVFSWAIYHEVAIAYIADTERRQHRHFLSEAFKYPYLRFFFANINYALTVGDANEEYFRYVGLKQEQLVRMHFPIDIQLYSDSYTKKQALAIAIRQQYEIPANEFTASVVGKLVTWKNQGDIIDAMLLLESKGIYMHLFLIGSGETEQQLRDKAAMLTKSKVYFTGFTNTELLPGYYAASDVYIHPASVEPHSLAISEAIYMGCPVIISDRCGSYGTTDDVQEGKNGHVYPFGNIEALAGCIERLMLNSNEREAFGNYSHSISVQFQQRSHKGVLDTLKQKLSVQQKLTAS